MDEKVYVAALAAAIDVMLKETDIAVREGFSRRQAELYLSGAKGTQIADVTLSAAAMLARFHTCL